MEFGVIVKEALRIFPKTKKDKPFDHFGVAYSEKETNQALTKFLISGDHTDLAEYADVVTYAFADAVADQMPSSLQKVSNSTSIANVAFMAEYSEIPQNREAALALLTSFRNSWKSSIIENLIFGSCMIISLVSIFYLAKS